ncbi:MAG TPA: hypothetical protein VFX05_15755 [Casimicrobiaceae bacterium]|nr:hypothetical protein [Casimicrobiaceae bacterium]
MHPISSAVAICGLAAAVAASAQPRVDDPAAPGSPAPALRYHSAFAGYKALGEAGVGNWREVNDRVRDAAAAAARSQGQAMPAAVPPAQGPSAAPPAAHGHHGGKP